MSNLKISKTQILKVIAMQKRAARNRSNNNNAWENSVEMRWKLSKNGKWIIFDGWLKQRGTSYPNSDNISIQCSENENCVGFVVGYDADKLNYSRVYALCDIESEIERGEEDATKLAEDFNVLNYRRK